MAANTLRPDSNQVGTTVSQAALADEAKRIAAAFDPDSPEQTLDDSDADGSNALSVVK